MKDDKLPEAERRGLAERHAARAVNMLVKLIAAGHFDDLAKIDHLKKDPDLDSLRGRADFQKLLQELEAKLK